MKVAECRGCKNLLERPPYWCEYLVSRQQLRNMKACPSCPECGGSGKYCEDPDIDFKCEICNGTGKARRER